MKSLHPPTLTRRSLLLTASATLLHAQPKPTLIARSEMRTLGLIGGTSWYSTVEYYRYINQTINERYGDNTNPPLVLFNLNQQHVFELQRQDRWDDIADMLSDAARKLRGAGAEAVMFCANTPHKVYKKVVANTRMRILHIGDATGNAIVGQKLKKVGLLGTIFTMEDGFIPEWLKEHFGVDALAPTARGSRVELHRIIQQELDLGQFLPKSKSYILAEIEKLRRSGAQGIILGCTEFPLIIKQADVAIPVFDTTTLHAQFAVEYILRVRT